MINRARTGVTYDIDDGRHFLAWSGVGDSHAPVGDGIG
jgi:hypothetical protein